MIRAAAGALISHWLRHPVQLAMLLTGLALATALWSGVQAINAEARAAYARAAGVLGQSPLERLVAEPGEVLTIGDYVALRRSGWAVSPVLEGRLRGSGLRVIGVEPLTLPKGAAVAALPDLSAGMVAGFLGGRQVLVHPEVLDAPEVMAELAGFEVVTSDDLPPMTVLADIGAAERLLGMPGRISALALDPDQPQRGPIPKGLQREEAGADAGLSRLTDSFHLNLTAFGFLAFAVGIFIVHSAIGLALEQRRPVFRTLRALGLSAGVLAGLLVAELTALALVAGLAGVVLGYAVAAALLPDVAATLSGLYGAAVPGTLHLRAEWWAVGLAVAVLGTLAAAARGIWQVWRMPLLAAAQPRAWARAAGVGRRMQALAGIGSLAGGLGLYLLGAGLWAGFGVLAGLLLGVALVLPSVLGFVLDRAATLAKGPVAEWFWADARLQLPGLSLALMALLLAVAANVGVGTMVASFRATFTGWLDQRLASEMYVEVSGPEQAVALRGWLEPKVDAVLPVITAPADLMGQPGDVYGIVDHATYRDNWPILSAVDGVWAALAAGEGVLVNEQFFRRQGLALGDEVALPGGSLPVLGVYSDYGNPLPQAILGMQAFASRFPEATPRRFALRVGTERVAGLTAELRAAFDLGPESVIDQAGIKGFSVGVFERTFAVTGALNGLTLGVAALAIFASLLTLAGLRLPQVAPVWAVGLTQRRLAGLDLARTVALAALTVVVALPLGLGMAWVLLAVVNVEAFGWRLPMQIFPLQWLVLCGTAVGAALVAALIPALTLARRSPAEMIKVFANER